MLREVNFQNHALIYRVSVVASLFFSLPSFVYCRTRGISPPWVPWPSSVAPSSAAPGKRFFFL
jgi:hypothetical protein